MRRLLTFGPVSVRVRRLDAAPPIPALRSMKRRVLNGMTALSLLLCVAVVALWVRTYWVRDRVFSEQIGHVQDRPVFTSWCMEANRGRVCVDFYRNKVTTKPPDQPVPGFDTRWTRLAWPSQPGAPAWPGTLGFWFDAKADGRGYRARAAIMPLWLPAVLFAALPAWRYIRRDRRLARLGRLRLCTQCGYDLRATPDRCPECGTMAVAPTGQ